MVENTGNRYRTRQAVVTCLIMVAAAAAVLLVGVLDVDILVAVGAFVLAVGLIITGMSFTFSSVPDKFGASEQNYRLAAGLVIAVIGALLVMIGMDVNVYVCIAVFILGIAAIGLCATFLGNKSSKY